MGVLWFNTIYLFIHLFTYPRVTCLCMTCLSALCLCVQRLYVSSVDSPSFCVICKSQNVMQVPNCRGWLFVLLKLLWQKIRHTHGVIQASLAIFSLLLQRAGGVF